MCFGNDLRVFGLSITTSIHKNYKIEEMEGTL